MERIVWHNSRPASPRFCRPLKIEFKKETAQHAQLQVENVRNQERQLVPLEIEVNGNKINVSYKLQLTMVDGKICNALTDTTSTQRCYLCNATSAEFNDIDAIISRPLNDDNLQYGLSTLHAWIRIFECCLQVAYRMEVKTWQVRNSKSKELVEERKKKIREGLKRELSLIVDRPKQVYGSSNDGNTARRFFEHSEISANITGLNLELLRRFHTVLQVLSSGYRIDLDIYEEYAIRTARLFVDLYPWFCMPTTVHKILLHGKDVIQNSLLPIGQMSEEAQEACNKFLRKFREDFTRKCSRKKTMEDLFVRMMLHSDPIISSQLVMRSKPSKVFYSEAMNILYVSYPTESASTSESEDDSSDGTESDCK